jgi:hypothetical protein
MDKKEIFLHRGETSSRKKYVFLLRSSFMLTSTRVAINLRSSSKAFTSETTRDCVMLLHYVKQYFVARARYEYLINELRKHSEAVVSSSLTFCRRPCTGRYSVHHYGVNYIP